MKRFQLKLSLVSGIFIFSCNPLSINFEAEKKTILEIEAKARDFHFKKDAKSMVEGFSNDFISINKGRIEKPDRNSSFEKFDAYFKSVEFIKWDNNAEPIVRFSDDASVAYVAVDKSVIVKYAIEPGMMALDTTEFAWLSVFKKEGGKWALDCIASTNR